MAVLQELKGNHPGQLVPLDGDQMVIGRHPDCDIVLDVGAVSRQHAQILRVGNDHFVEDLGSRNGTIINGERITGRYRLRENDRLKVCDVLFTFHTTPPRVAADDSAAAVLVDDRKAPSSSTIMSMVDISSSRSGLHVAVNPEVKLKALLEISRNLASTLTLDEVLPKILDSLFKIFAQADRGFLVLRDDASGVLVPKAVKYRRGDDGETMRISRTVVDRVLTSKEAILSADAAADSRFEMSQSLADFRIRSMMCAPLVDSEGRALGVIQIDTLDQRSRFTQDDLDVLASVASQAAFTVEIARLHETALREQALERDLSTAHRVQQGFLPMRPPTINGYSFFDFYEPAHQIGGDYFDYVKLPNHRVAVVLADVSGKGIPAALLMAKLSAETRFCLASEATPAAAIERLNEGFNRDVWEDRFVTLVLAVLDLEAHQVTIVNAGHMAPFLRHADAKIVTVSEEITGLPLGVVESFRYEQETIQLEPGDSLTVFTDGLSEAMNAENELYGLERLKNSLSAQCDGIEALGKHVLDDVKKFAGERSQSDDMCMICFGRDAGR